MTDPVGILTSILAGIMVAVFLPALLIADQITVTVYMIVIAVFMAGIQWSVNRMLEKIKEGRL